MKRITGLTEGQAAAIAASVVTYRAVRGASITRDRDSETISRSFVVEVETFAAEEESVVVETCTAEEESAAPDRTKIAEAISDIEIAEAISDIERVHDAKMWRNVNGELVWRGETPDGNEIETTHPRTLLAAALEKLRTVLNR